MKRISLFAILAVTPIWAQRASTFNAEVRGSGSSGKCTIEVVVDGVAEVEIRGGQGVLRTISGRPARWVRFQCNAPFPTSGMGSFRFHGVDGRGRQHLIRDPRENRGVAVIGIEDRDGGEEGYTFDLEWRDAYFGGGGQGQGIGQGPGPRPPIIGGGRVDTKRAIRICQDAVAARMDREYGIRDPEFERIEMDNGRGREDWVIGTLRAGRRDRYEFSCAVDFRNGSVGRVDVRRR